MKNKIFAAVVLAVISFGIPVYAECPGQFINIDNRLDEAITVTPRGSSCWYMEFSPTVIAANSKASIYTEGMKKVGCRDKPVELNFEISSGKNGFHKMYKLEKLRDGISNYWALSGDGETKYGRRMNEDLITAGCYEFSIVVK